MVEYFVVVRTKKRKNNLPEEILIQGDAIFVSLNNRLDSDI